MFHFFFFPARGVPVHPHAPCCRRPHRGDAREKTVPRRPTNALASLTRSPGHTSPQEVTSSGLGSTVHTLPTAQLSRMWTTQSRACQGLDDTSDLLSLQPREPLTEMGWYEPRSLWSLAMFKITDIFFTKRCRCAAKFVDAFIMIYNVFLSFIFIYLLLTELLFICIYCQ